MRKELAVGICFCVAGILCACLFGSEYFAGYGFLNEYHLKSFAVEEQDIWLLLWNVLWERAKFFILVGLAAATSLRKILPLLMRCLICFTLGIYLAACVINMGGFGALFFVLSCIPHGIFYLAALFLLLRRKEPYRYQPSKAVIRKVMYVAGVTALILAGCTLEAFLGTKIQKWVICTIYHIYK